MNNNQQPPTPEGASVEVDGIPVTLTAEEVQELVEAAVNVRVAHVRVLRQQRLRRSGKPNTYELESTTSWVMTDALIRAAQKIGQQA